jgi:hypothetical protein
LSRSPPACRDNTCTELRIEACIARTCTNSASKIWAANSTCAPTSNRGETTKISTSKNNAPWCVVRKSVFFPLTELYGHRGSAWPVQMRAASNGLHGKMSVYRTPEMFCSVTWALPLLALLKWADARTVKIDLSLSLPGLHSFIFACYLTVLSW